MILSVEQRILIAVQLGFSTAVFGDIRINPPVIGVLTVNLLVGLEEAPDLTLVRIIVISQTSDTVSLTLQSQHVVVNQSGKLDSLNTMSIVTGLEDQAGQTLADEHSQNVDLIGQLLADFVVSLLHESLHLVESRTSLEVLLDLLDILLDAVDLSNLALKLLDSLGVALNRLSQLVQILNACLALESLLQLVECLLLSLDVLGSSLGSGSLILQSGVDLVNLRVDARNGL